MTDTPAVVAAKARAQLAKTRMNETLAELQTRLSPTNIVHNAWADTVDRSADAWDSAVERGTEMLAIAVDRTTQAGETSVAFVQKRPGVVAAAAGGALALLAGPSLVRRAFRRPPPKPVPTDPPRLTGPIPHLETRP